MLLGFFVENYRSLQRVRLELGQLSVIVGANGVGKTNLYKALWLISAAARGDLLPVMARDGGLPSAHCVGAPLPKSSKKQPFRMRFELEFDDLCYRLEIGYPPLSSIPPGGYFTDDPHVKEELVWPRADSERAFLFRRAGSGMSGRDENGRILDHPLSVASWEVGLAELREPNRFPELHVLRHRVTRWRFYHGFRTDADAPARQTQVAFYSPVLDADGANLVAALRTIHEIGDGEMLEHAVSTALEGAALSIDKLDDRRLALSLTIPGLYRPLAPSELSDGQLRFLLLAAAALSPRPPELMVFNEPETSLHERALPELAKLLASAAEHSQLIVTTHSGLLAAELAKLREIDRIELRKQKGVTVVEPPE